MADLSRATFSNIESQSIEFWTDTMLPWAECWESSIERFLLGEDTDLEVEFDMRRLMRGDSASRTAYYQGGIQSGWLTRNEAREAEGYDPLDGLDEPLMPLNMVEESKAEELESATESAPSRPPSEESLRLQAILEAGARRLARRASGALAKRPGTEVFDDGFAELMAEALGMDAGLARQTCAELAHAAGIRPLTEEQIAQALMVGATYTLSPEGGPHEG